MRIANSCSRRSGSSRATAPFTDSGFAIPLADIGYLYGQEVDGIVVALGLGLVGSGLGDLSPVIRLTERHGLLFVDWVRGVVIEPGDANGFRRWLDAIIDRDPDGI